MTGNGTRSLIGRRTASNDAEACEDDPIVALSFNSQYASRARDKELASRI
jgi:hypothetical protein